MNLNLRAAPRESRQLWDTKASRDRTGRLKAYLRTEGHVSADSTYPARRREDAVPRVSLSPSLLLSMAPTLRITSRTGTALINSGSGGIEAADASDDRDESLELLVSGFNMW